MDHEKRVILAFALSFAILVLWRAFLVKEAPTPPPPAKPQPGAVQTAPGRAPEAAPAATPEAEAPPQRVPLSIQQGSQAEEIVIEGKFSRVTLSTQGGVVQSWLLKAYQDEDGKPLDVVNRAACEALGFPMSLRLADPELTRKLNSALFFATPADASLTAPARVEFIYSDGKVQARKQLSFAQGYEVQVEASVFDGLRYLPVEVAWPGGFGDHSAPERTKDASNKAVYEMGGELKTESRGKVEEPRSIPGPLRLAGLEDRYFVSIFLPGAPDQAFRFDRQTWTPPDWKGEEKDKPKSLVGMLGSGEAKPLEFRLFVAPKDLDVLRSVNPRLDHLVDYGWFSFVAKPLFLALRYLHDHWIHNYGWAIVILTILITMAFLPLKLKQIRSAQEMQRVAPVVKSIQEKYKQYKFNDPRKQRMQQEIMKVYKEHNINPLGGCLPMLLQLPFLYGFYRVLDFSIELRHAPWFLWITDLSAPDRFYILPVAMTVTMFIMQKMTPMATADPTQQRMMMMMPLFFGFICLNFASGLVLYWLTSNLVGIGQQVFINRMMPAPAPIQVQRKAATAKE